MFRALFAHTKLLALTGTLAAGMAGAAQNAHAGTRLSFGLSLGPIFAPAPVLVTPAPQPVIVTAPICPAPVIYTPAPVVYATPACPPATIVVDPRFGGYWGPRFDHGHFEHFDARFDHDGFGRDGHR